MRNRHHLVDLLRRRGSAAASKRIRASFINHQAARAIVVGRKAGSCRPFSKMKRQKASAYVNKCAFKILLSNRHCRQQANSIEAAEYRLALSGKATISAIIVRIALKLCCPVPSPA